MRLEKIVKLILLPSLHLQCAESVDWLCFKVFYGMMSKLESGVKKFLFQIDSTGTFDAALYFHGPVQSTVA
jgi:hypothetical protein